MMMPTGAPVVIPSWPSPAKIWHWSVSCRGELSGPIPGLRLSISSWIIWSDNFNPGGTPSTMTANPLPLPMP